MIYPKNIFILRNTRQKKVQKNYLKFTTKKLDFKFKKYEKYVIDKI